MARGSFRAGFRVRLHNKDHKTCRDMAAGKSFAAWVKKYNEKKAAGEKDIGIEPEPLDE